MNKERKILINKVLEIKVCLTKEDFFDIIKGKIVDPDDSYAWINRNIIGNITVEKMI